MKVPAGTSCAVVMVVFGRFVVERLAQSAAPAVRAAAAVMRLRVMRVRIRGIRMWQLPEPGQRSTPMATPCERKTGSGSRQRRRCRLVSCIAPLETKGAAPKTQGNCVRCVGAQGKHGAAPALVMTPSRGLGTEAGGPFEPFKIVTVGMVVETFAIEPKMLRLRRGGG